jgi:hypothetical protein
VTAVAKAVKGLAATLNRVAGLWGSYSRVGGGTHTIRGVLTVRDYEVVDDQGIVTLTKSHDWLFRACDLGNSMPPETGDRWKVNTGQNYLSNGEQDDFELPYQAMEIGNRPCYEPHDAQGIMVVVHMKRVPNA